MIIDCHTHIDYKADDTACAEHLEACEKANGCMVLANRPKGAGKEINKQLSEYVSKYADKMTGFGIVEPLTDNVSIKKLSALRDGLGLKGIVLYCCDGSFHPAHSRAMRLYESAQELGMPVFFHNGPTLGPDAVLDYAQPYLLDEIARNFGALKIIIGNMGLPFIEQTLCMLGKHENVYADLTVSPNRIWQTYNVVVSAYEREVMDKLLFGSGYPFGDAGACMEALLGFNKLLANTNLPTVPRGSIRSIIERDTLGLLGIKD